MHESKVALFKYFGNTDNINFHGWSSLTQGRNWGGGSDKAAPGGRDQGAQK